MADNNDGKRKVPPKSALLLQNGVSYATHNYSRACGRYSQDIITHTSTVCLDASTRLLLEIRKRFSLNSGRTHESQSVGYR